MSQTRSGLFIVRNWDTTGHGYFLDTADVVSRLTNGALVPWILGEAGVTMVEAAECNELARQGVRMLAGHSVCTVMHELNSRVLRDSTVHEFLVGRPVLWHEDGERHAGYEISRRRPKRHRDEISFRSELTHQRNAILQKVGATTLEGHPDESSFVPRLSIGTVAAAVAGDTRQEADLLRHLYAIKPYAASLHPPIARVVLVQEVRFGINGA